MSPVEIDFFFGKDGVLTDWEVPGGGTVDLHGIAELDPLEPGFVGSCVAAEEGVVGGLSEGNLTRYMGVAGGGLDVEDELAVDEFAVEVAKDVFSGFNCFLSLRLSARPSSSHIKRSPSANLLNVKCLEYCRNCSSVASSVGLSFQYGMTSSRWINVTTHERSESITESLQAKRS